MLTESPFSLEDLNRARLRLLGSLPGTQMKQNDVLSVNDTLLVHCGQHFEHIACLWDQAEGRYVWAHNPVNLHYSDDKADYPVAFRLWEPADVEALEQGLRAADSRLRENKQALKTEAPHNPRGPGAGRRPPPPDCDPAVTSGGHVRRSRPVGTSRGHVRARQGRRYA